MINYSKRGTMFSFLFFCVISLASAQVNYNVKIMSWNLLNFPNSTPTSDSTIRCPYYRTVVNYVQPDIMVTMENTSSTGATWVLNNVMNSGIYHYEQGTFINGYDSDNSIYFRDSLFRFISNIPIQTALRDISHFTLQFIPTGDTIHIFAVHLKASQGFETNRAAEVALLRNVTNAFPTGTNFMVMGDFNIYTSLEPAYSGLLQDNASDDGNFLDPLNMPGGWNYRPYSPYHTQSTRLTAFGGGATAGLNDRFDMILFSNAIQLPRGVYFLQGTYNAVGNDGNHFNQSINNNVNTAVPVSVADALYYSSDHLPVELTLQIGPTSSISEQIKSEDVRVFPNPTTGNFYIQMEAQYSGHIQITLTDLMGRICYRSEVKKVDFGTNYFAVDLEKDVTSGIYLLTISDNKSLINKKIAVSK